MCTHNIYIYIYIHTYIICLHTLARVPSVAILAQGSWSGIDGVGTINTEHLILNTSYYDYYDYY